MNGTSKLKPRLLIIDLGRSDLGERFSQLLRINSRNLEFDRIKRVGNKLFLNGEFFCAAPKMRLTSLIPTKKYRDFENKMDDLISAFEYQGLFVTFMNPWDVRYQFKSSKSLVIFRIIHDAKKHPGDSWPSSKIISKVNQASSSIYLSKFVADSLGKLHDFVVVPHPFIYDQEVLRINGSSWLSSEPSSNFLVIGRMRRYQNPTRAFVWWISDGKRKFPHHKLRYVGLSVPILVRIFSKLDHSIEVINSRVTDVEFIQHIASSAVALNLYKEASQSGIVAAAKILQTPVLVTNVGALAEQSNNKEETIEPNDGHRVISSKLMKLIEKNAKMPDEILKKIDEVNSDYVEKIESFILKELDEKY